VRRRGGVVPALLFALAGCGGGAPLLHPAHVLPPGAVRAGAGLSGQIALRSFPALKGVATPVKLQQLTAAPGVAPWVSARIGIQGENEAGLTYTGRSLRLDGRHAFSLGAPTLSVGLGASALSAQRPGEGADGSSVFGGGFDVPILFGARSASDLYSIWVGPRAGMEFLSGRVAIDGMSPLSNVTARHIFAGVLAGLKVGFRHVHAAIELDFTYHRADGVFAGAKVGLSQLALTPGGALLLSF
jgi:hypothetical protein